MSLKLSIAVKKTWQNAHVRNARSQRHNVLVNGLRFRSVYAAFRHFRLPVNKHERFRLALVKDGYREFTTESGVLYQFRLVERVEWKTQLVVNKPAEEWVTRT